MERITVRYVVKGTVVEEAFTAERITYQRRGKRLQVHLWRNGQAYAWVSYRRAERVYREIET